MELFNLPSDLILPIVLAIPGVHLLVSAIVFSGNDCRGAGLAILANSITFILAVLVFANLWNGDVRHFSTAWFTIGDRMISVGIFLNNLTVLMLLLVTTIALLVQIYSKAYMKGDPGIRRYWTWLNFFCFSMLGLVLADNLLVLYMFWELVGFSSYLLIGYWYTRDSAAAASKKAFIMNRIGDVGFLCGLMIVFSHFGTFDIPSLFGGGVTLSSQISESWLIGAGIAFLLGALAKSAQFPLHTWLPDAMEGPTSVSSLIHAATMVAAGVFLIARIYPLFHPDVLVLITGLGAFTALMAATIAITQTDLKKILAYSTVSQLGFMIAALGVGAYSEAIFHLASHAFFKCLLFLGAGAIIHELQHLKDKAQFAGDPQDINSMGGFRKQMPVVFLTMLLAAAAISGLPLTSGFLSKDALLVGIFERASELGGALALVPYILVVVSWLTTFYIFRLFFKVFFGESRIKALHDAPALMAAPLILLAICCSFLFFSLNPFSPADSWILAGFASPGSGHSVLVPILVNTGTLLVILLCWLVYVKGKFSGLVRNAGILYRFSLSGWYFDAFYRSIFVRPVEKAGILIFAFDRLVVDGVVNLSGILLGGLSQIADWFDRNIVDGLVKLAGDAAKWLGSFTRQFQTGRVQHYLLTMLSILIAFFALTFLI